MAGLSLIVFGIVVVSCSSAHFNGFDHTHDFPSRQQTNTLFNPVTPPNVEDRKCFTLTRRRFFMTRLMKYPCFRRAEGIPVIRSYMGRFGPICLSYIREPVFRFFRVPQCCPGFTTDNQGKCSIPVGQNAPVEPEQQPQFPRPNFPEMMAMAANMRRRMWQRAQESMAKRRALFIMNMERMRNSMMRHNMMQQMMPPRLPFQKMMNVRRNQRPPTITYLQFRRPSSPPVPHPIPRPPMSGRIIKIIRNKMFPNNPMMHMMPRPMFTPPSFAPPQQRQVPKIILSNRENFMPLNKLREFHPPSTQLRVALRLAPNMMPYISSAFPQDIPDSPAVDGMFNNDNNPAENQPFSDMPQGFTEPGMQEASEANMQVDLPDRPVEMPDLIVEEGPMNEGNPESCIAMLETAVKTCLKQNHIDVPDVMSAFEPFNDDTSRDLCVSEDEIFNCISDAVVSCIDTQEGAVAREMLHETAGNVRSMCALRAASVTADHAQVQQADAPSTADKTKTEETVKGGETMATVENVDAIPTDVKPASHSEQPTAADTAAVAADAVSPAASLQDVIQHELDMQDALMKDYYLPILIGAGVGFFIIVLIMSLLVCFCCKRKMKKKMKMSKELEKPPLQDGIYTIGVAPPVYETNGIPPLYYEEAKGEKISSRSPSVVEGCNDDDVDGENTQM